MKNYRLLLTCVVVVFSSLLVGCSLFKSPTTNPKKTTITTTNNNSDYNGLFNDVNTKMNEVLDFTTNMRVDFASSYMTMITDVQINSDFENENNGKMEINTTVKIGTTEETVQSYMVFNDQKVYQYTPFLSNWLKTEMNSEDFDDENTDLSQPLTNYKSVQYLRDIKLNDNTDVALFKVKLSSEDFTTHLSGLGDLLTTLEIDESKIQLYKEDIEILLYIDQTNKYLRKMEFDLVPFFSMVSSMNVTKANYVYEFNNFGNVNVTIPQTVFDNLIESTEVKDEQLVFSFTFKDTAIHTNKPIIYAISDSTKKLYAINYDTKETKTFDLAYNPETIYYRDGYVYVAFSTKGHTPYIEEQKQEGALAIIHADDLTLKTQFDIEVDPFDMVVDHQGFIYITSGSGQNSSPIDSYNSIGLRVSRAYIKPSSYAVIDDMNSKIYTVDTTYSPRDMKYFTFNTGRITGSKELSYHGDYPLTTNIHISPDGNHLYNGMGHVFDSQMTYKKPFPLPFTDLAFNTNNNNKMYTVMENNIVSYEYGTYSIKNIYTTEEPIKKVYVNLNQLVTVGSDYVQVINEGNHVIETPLPNIPQVPSHYDDFKDVVLEEYTSDQIKLPFSFTKYTFHPTEPIIFATNKTLKSLYAYNFESNELKTLTFDLPTESLYYRKGKLYVTLLKGDHSPFWDDAKGAIGIVDVNTMTLTNQLDIDLDPYDIAVDNDGYIYVTSGSSQHTSVNVYNSIGMIVDFVSTYEQSIIKYDFINNYMYVLGNGDNRYPIENGKFLNKETYFSSSLPDFIRFSPNGNQIYSGNTIISTSSLEVVKQLEFSYSDLTFDELNNHYYTARKNNILQFDYTTHKLLGLYKVNGNIIEIVNTNNQLVTMYTKDDTNYYLEVIHQDQLLKHTKNVDDYAQDNQAEIELLKYDRNTFTLDHTVTDVAIHPTEPVLYIISASDMKLYAYNYQTKAVTEVQFDVPLNKIKIINNKLYLALDNDPLSTSKGKIVTLDLNTLTLVDQIAIDVIPLDFTVDSNNYVYVKSRELNKFALTSYDSLGNKIDQEFMDLSYRLKLDLINNKLYGYVYENYNTKYFNYNLNNGIMNLQYLTNGYNFSLENSHLSPDGKYIFNYNGDMYDVENNFALHRSLGYYLSNVEFDQDYFYLLANDLSIYRYNYETEQVNGFYKLNSENIKYFFVHNDQMIYLTNYEYSSYKVNVLTKTTGTPVVVEDSTVVAENPVLIDLEGNKTNIDFLVTNVVKDPTKPILYMVSSSDTTIYALNYQTNEMRSISFNLIPENIVYKDGKLYVTLLKGQHSPFWFTKDQKGAIAIVDATSMTLIKEFDILLDPADVAVDHEGYIYVSSGSGQWTNLASFDPVTYQQIASTQVREGSQIEMHPELNKLYVGDSSFSTYYLSKGILTKDVQRSWEMKYFSVAPDGNLVFDALGTVYYSNISNEDLLTKTKLGYHFNDIAFDLENDLFYIASENKIYKYQYSTLKLLGHAEVNQPIKKIFIDGEQLITVNKGTLNDNFVEVLKVDTTVEDPIQETPVVSAKPLYFNIDSIELSHTVTDTVMHPTLPILYISSATTRTLYAYNIETNEVNELSFDYPIENIAFANNKIYAILEKPQPFTSTEKGYVVIVNVDTFTIENQFAIGIRPYDIAADHNGYIYVSPHEGNDNYYLNSYDSLGNKIATLHMDQKSNLYLHPRLNRIYALNSGLSSLTLSVLVVHEGNIESHYDINSNLRQTYFSLSPEGRYYFHQEGYVNYVSFNKSEDSMRRFKLANTFNAIGFDLPNNQFYTANNKSLSLYDYSTYDLLGYATFDEDIKSLHTFNGKVIAITKNQYYSYTLNIMTKSETPVVVPPVEVQTPEPINYATNPINLSTTMTNVIKHPTQTILYYVDSENKKLYSYDYTSGVTKELSFTLTPENLIFHNDQLYVTLLTKPHDMYWTYNQTGAIAIVDANSLEKINEFNVSIDPYDLAIGHDNVLYITSGSGQWTEMQSYDLTTYTKISSTRKYQQTIIEMNPVFNRLYYYEYEFRGLGINQGNFYLASNIYMSEQLNSQFKISPDGKYIFNGTGVVMYSSLSMREDTLIKTKLHLPFTDIAFDIDHNTFYTILDTKLYQYDYDTFELVGITQLSEQPSKLFYDGSKIVLINNSGLKLLTKIN